jgi:peptidoglycan/LPS O-acetylase OafA/YrhL
VTPFARCLGNISFSFYIVHHTVAWTIGYYITNEAIARTGSHDRGFAIGMPVTILVAIWLADIHWGLFDDGSVKFARWLWTKCSTAPQDFPTVTSMIH